MPGIHEINYDALMENGLPTVVNGKPVKLKAGNVISKTTSLHIKYFVVMWTRRRPLTIINKVPERFVRHAQIPHLIRDSLNQVNVTQ